MSRISELFTAVSPKSHIASVTRPFSLRYVFSSASTMRRFKSGYFLLKDFTPKYSEICSCIIKLSPPFSNGHWYSMTWSTVNSLLSLSPTSMRPFFFILSVVAVLIALPCDSSPGPSVPPATGNARAGVCERLPLSALILVSSSNT